MSIMVVQLVPEGILIGADRNITIGVQQGSVVTVGQSQRPKVLKWPNRQVIVGYVGRAEIEGEPMDRWLYDFIGRNLETALPELAAELKSKLEFDLGSDVAESALLLHLAGFVADRGQWKPQVWFLRNTGGVDERGDYIDLQAEFALSEEIAQPIYFGEQSGDEIRFALDQRARAWRPFWFHQGYDLGTFNALDEVIRIAMKIVVEEHPAKPHQFPEALEEWEKHLRMAILTYGAYFAAFHQPFEQYVGGGADVVWAQWPKVGPGL